MLKIWGRKTSVNVQKVMWAVGELGVPYERIDAGGTFGKTDTAAYGAINPNRLVPTIDDNGFTLWESNACVRHLAQKYGRGKLSPANEHDFARADQWMDWSITTIYADIISTCFWGLIRTAAKDRNNEAIKAAAKRVGEKLAILDGQLAGREFIVGKELSIADIANGVLMYRYMTLPIERPKLANVEAWYQRLTVRPAYKEHAMVDYLQMKVPGA